MNWEILGTWSYVLSTKDLISLYLTSLEDFNPKKTLSNRILCGKESLNSSENYHLISNWVCHSYRSENLIDSTRLYFIEDVRRELTCSILGCLQLSQANRTLLCSSVSSHSTRSSLHFWDQTHGLLHPEEQLFTVQTLYIFGPSAVNQQVNITYFHNVNTMCYLSASFLNSLPSTICLIEILYFVTCKY